jgi:hypothetical protein
MNEAGIQTMCNTEIDAALARLIMGWVSTDEGIYKSVLGHILPLGVATFQPTRNPAHTEMVAEKLRTLGWSVVQKRIPAWAQFRIHADGEDRVIRTGNSYMAEVVWAPPQGSERKRPDVWAIAASAELALCRAALYVARAVEQEYAEEEQPDEAAQI